MPEVLATVDESRSGPWAVQLDLVCDRFEAAWKSAGPGGQPPRIEVYLADSREPERSVLLQHLVLLEIDYRRLRGESPTLQDYLPRFPALSSQLLAEAFPKPLTPPSPEWEETQAPLPTTSQPRSDRYVIREFHARGGIGEVWLAEDSEIGRPVALKRLREKSGGHEERFLVEARITGQLEHPGIVPVHDLGIDEDGRPFYIMTFIHGRTLKEVIDEYHASCSANKETPEVPRCRLLEIFVKVCEAIAYAHNRGVIHRDLKPDNVMVGPYGETLVLDWGMAKLLNVPEQSGGDAPVQLTYFAGSTKTQAGLVMGSPWYMAPEVAEGKANDADERTDVYLLGATLYHMLTGKAPREGRNLQDIIELARNGDPPAPRKLKADVPRALEAICLKAMAHHSRDRYPGALELAGDVQCFLAGAPVSAYPEPLLARAWRWCGRHRRALTRSLASAAVLSVMLFGVVLLTNARRREAALVLEAEEYRRQKQGRRNLAAFQRLTEERQFYAASSIPSGDRPLQYDPSKSQDAGEKALALANQLTEELDLLRMPDEQAAFRKQLHDLLLLMVQAQSQQSPGPKSAQIMLQRLDRAASLEKQSRGYHRLQARCYQLMGDNPRRDEEARRADDPRLPITALDHFLQAIQAQSEAVSSADGHGDPTHWQPNRELLATAVEHYQAALRLEPDHYWCHFHLGRCYLSLGRGSEAVEALGTCVALQPQLPWGYSARGLALGLIQRYADGEEDLNRALTLEPNFPPALLNRGILAWKQRKIDRALADFGKVLEPGEKRLIAAAYIRGLLQAEQGKFREALVDFDLVVHEAPDFRFVYLPRAQVHFLQDNPQGLTDLTTFLKLGMPARPDQTRHILHTLRGRLLRHLVPSWGLSVAQTAAALRLAQDELNRAIQLGSHSAEVFDDLGSILELRGEPVKAFDIYTQALAAAPMRDLEMRILSKRGWILAQSLEQPAQDKARQEFVALLRLAPDSADARAGLGYLAVRRKSAPEAQREAVHGLLNGAGDHLALHNLACIYAELSQVDREQTTQHEDVAIALLKRAVELWRRGGTGPNAIVLIRGETSFESLRNREDFKKLLGE